MQIIFLLLSIVANRFTHVDGCKELWFNECVDNSDCCSTYCDRPADFKYGVCKPESLKNDIGNKVGCHENDYNLCKVDENCCSGYCDRPESWEHGVCKDSKKRSKFLCFFFRNLILNLFSTLIR